MENLSPQRYRPGKAELVRIGIIIFAIVADWSKFWRILPNPEWLELIVTLIGAYPILKVAFSNMLARRMTMELSMAIAIVAALTIGEHLTALVIAFFVLIAEILENLTVDRGRHAIKNLLDLLPRQANVKRNGQTQEIKSDQLKAGDIVLIKPGERISVDGLVVSGHSFADQSAITGESLPVEKFKGSKVYAGTINQSGAMEVKTLQVGRETAFGKIIEAVEKAEKSRAPIQKTADILAGYLVYFSFACAIITFIVTKDVKDTISVIIVAGACGVAAGTPLAVLGAIGQAARLGSIVKGGLYMELLSKIDTVVLDKTGTLTFGNPEVSQIITAEGIEERKLIEAAGIAERFSEHPFSKAVLKKADELSVTISEPENFMALPGKGIICTFDGEEIVLGRKELLVQRNVLWGAWADRGNHAEDVLVARGGRILGALKFSDVLRPEASEAIRGLKQKNIRTILLTGDADEIASAVARQLGVDEVTAHLLPEQKLARIKELMAAKKNVAMIGDGINDAPALMQATVGVAMGSGTDVARESAQILLIGNNLLKFVETIRIAQHCYGIIIFNFVGTLVVDGVGMVLAASGFLNPMMAAFIHVSSELIFILNSARLFPARSS